MTFLLLAFANGGLLEAAAPSLIQYVLAPSIPLIASGIGWALLHAGMWFKAKTANTKLAGATAAAVDFVSNAVKHVVDGLKADVQAALANDGIIDEQEKAALLAKASTLVKAELPDGLRSVLESTFGKGLETQLRGMVSKALDGHLDDMASDHDGHSVEPTVRKVDDLNLPTERPTRP